MSILYLGQALTVIKFGKEQQNCEAGQKEMERFEGQWYVNCYHVQFYLHFIQANNKMTVFPISHRISVFQL